ILTHDLTKHPVCPELFITIGYLLAIPAYPGGDQVNVTVGGILMVDEQVGLLAIAHAVHPFLRDIGQFLFAMGSPLGGNGDMELGVFSPAAACRYGRQVSDVLLWAEVFQSLEQSEVFGEQ